MPLSVHQTTVPVFRQSLAALSAVLDKAEAHCRDNDLDPAEFLERRLWPDMYTLTEQVRQATHHAVQCVAKLAQVETPTLPDAEPDFAKLRTRIADAISTIGSFTPDRFDGSEDRIVEIPTRVRVLTLPGADYLMHFAHPQFFFHVTTAYDLIRNAGVEIGKRDFLGDAADR